MNKNNPIKNPNLNKFDKDIIQQHSYNIIQDSAHLKNNSSNNKNNSIYNNSNNYTSEFNNDNNDEDNNLKLNFNINNYLSKHNSNSSKNNLSSSNKNIQKMKKNKNLKKKHNTGKNQNSILQKLNNNSKNSYKNIYSNNALHQKESNEALKSKLLARIRQQKDAFNAYNTKSNIYKNNISNNNNKKKDENFLPKKSKNEENGKIKIEKNEKNENNEKNEKNEEQNHVPKILTFLRTFKNFAKPFKANNEKENSNSTNDNKDNNSNENNAKVNPSSSCFNFNPKVKPKIGKLNLNKRNKNINNDKIYFDQNENGDENEGEDFIDYNRFTFRNNIDEDEILPYKVFNEKRNNNNLENNDKNKNSISNQNNNGDNIKTLYRNNKFLGQDNNKLIKNRNSEPEEISPNFKQRKNSKKNIYKKLYKYYNFTNINDNQPYQRKNYLKNKYSSPKPLPKGKGKITNNYSYGNLSKNNLNVPSYDNYENDNEDSFQSLNTSTRYIKPKINDSFPRNNYNNMSQIHKKNSYNLNDMSADRINLSKNYYTSNRPLKNNKIHEIVININDSMSLFNNENNFNTNNQFYSNRNPLKRRKLDTNSNSNKNKNDNYMKRSPLSVKQNGGVYDYSDNYDSSQYDDDEDSVKDKRNTNFSRFMEPFQRNDNNKWYNEDSYYSFDIINMNKIAKNNNLLYQKPLKSNNSNKNRLIKNNSMYVKRVVHYDKINKDALSDNNYNVMNDSGISSNYKNKKDYTDYEEKENNVHDFDAPKAIKDMIDDNISNSNNSDYINDSSRENQLSVNSEIKTNKLNDSINNTHSNRNNNKNNNNSMGNNKNNPNPNLSNKNQQNKEKIVYMKKINTVYNIYKGTKNFFSKINDKVFKMHKKEQNKNDSKIGIDINNKKDEKNDKRQNNDFIIPQGILTPRKLSDNEENQPTYNSKNSGNTPMNEDIIQEKQKKQDDNRYIKTKIINKKQFFMQKYYNYYLPKINKNVYGYYLCKIKPNNVYKIPIKVKYYMTKEKLKIYKIPYINNCYFHKNYIINNNNNSYNLEHQQFFSFFSIGDHYNPNNNSNVESLVNDNNSNNKISNLKQNINNNIKQFSLFMSNDINNLEDNNMERESFSFRNDQNILDSNHNKSKKQIKNENIEINNFHFSLNPKKEINKFETEKMQEEKNNELIFINDKEDKNKNINKKYDYKYIYSLKDNKYYTNNNLLPQNVIKHCDDLIKATESIPFSFSFIQNDKNEENKNTKKLNKDELSKIIKKFLTKSKKEELKKKIDKNFKTERSQEISQNKNINENEECNNSLDIKEKMEWARNDLSKEIEQAEKYIKDLRKKMEENTKKNDIIFLLNMLTVDNFTEILNKILILITKENNETLSDKDIIYNEYILIDVVADKAITEKRFVNLYAKLCYELYNKLNDKKYNDVNFNSILMEECKIKFNDLNNINNESNSDNNNDNNNNVNINDEKYFLIKKKFLGNIDFICELINVNILTQDFGFYYLDELYKKYNEIIGSNEIEKFKKNLCLEAIVNFLSKFGKKINHKKNNNNSKYLNDFINNNLTKILNDENLPSFLKYKIINLIEKQKNKWEDSLFEKSILAKGKKNIKKHNSLKKPHKSRKRKHSSLSIDPLISNRSSTENNNKYITYKSTNIETNKKNNISFINTTNTNNNNDEIIQLIEKDVENYGMFLKKNNINSKAELFNNDQIGNEYDWSDIEDIISQEKIDLGEVIRCYVEVCIDKITNNDKKFIANDYIKNIIYYYSINLTNKEKDIIHNKMISLFMNIQDICIDNYIMKEIMGYLLLVLIQNKLYIIKDLNNFIGMDKEIITTIAEVIKYTIISSEVKCKKYHNDFKQTKLFADNSIFTEQVTNKIQDILNAL